MTAVATLRGLNNLSQKELAEMTGLTSRTIGRYEEDIKYIREAKYKNVEKVAHVLGVAVDDIFLEDTSVFLKRINTNKICTD